MTRKVTLKFMSNNSERKFSFKERKRGIIKKVEELSTLCGVDACAVIYSQYENQPGVWPSPEGTTAVLSHYEELPEMEKTKKQMNQETFTLQRIEKMKDQLRRVQTENKRNEVKNFMYKCMVGMKNVEEFYMSNADIMNSVMEETLNELKLRMGSLQIGNPDQPVASISPPDVVAGFGSGSPAVVMVAEPTVPPPNTVVEMSSTDGENDQSLDMRDKLTNVGDFSKLPVGELDWLDGPIFSPCFLYDIIIRLVPQEKMIRLVLQELRLELTAFLSLSNIS
ncbi:hypothetical protein ACJIZ3_006449 [Penstemon smallii]|uniref:MADS-box domain-containing protein n=1 Tax=Penstemon smallii TaxID=265156 RepID=A0ABD3S7V1_9LAMI